MLRLVQTEAYAQRTVTRAAVVGIRSLVLVEWLEVPGRSLGQGKMSLLTAEI